MRFSKIAIVCPQSSVTEAIQFNPSTWRDVEAFICGDGGNHPDGGAVFATLDGPLRVRNGWWIVRTVPDKYAALPPEEFAAAYQFVRPKGVRLR